MNGFLRSRSSPAAEDAKLDLLEMRRERFRLETIEKMREWNRKAFRGGIQGCQHRPWYVPFAIGFLLGLFAMAVYAV